MITPNFRVERVLEGLCPPSHFRDGILGDLTEEFTQRQARDGLAAARRWHRREALRAVPHLIGHAARTIEMRDAESLGIAVVGSIFVLILVGIGVGGVVSAVGVTEAELHTFFGALRFNGHLIFGGLDAFVIGFFGSWFARRAPLLGAFASSAFWLGVGVVGQVVAGDLLFWQMGYEALVWLISAMLGGVLYIGTLYSPSSDDPRPAS